MITAHVNVANIDEFKSSIEETVQEYNDLGSGSSIDDIKTQIEEHIDAYEQMIEKFNTLLEQVNQKITTCIDKIESNTEKLKNKKDQLRQKQEQMQQLTHELTELQNSSSSSNSIGDKLLNIVAVPAIGAKIAAITAKIGALEAQIAKLTADITALSGLIAAEKSIKIVLEEKKLEVNAIIIEMKKNIQILKEKDKRVNNIGTTITDITHKISHKAENATKKLDTASRIIQEYMNFNFNDKFVEPTKEGFYAYDELKKLGLSKDEYNKISEDSGWSDEIVKYIRTENEYGVYKECQLFESVVGVKKCMKNPLLSPEMFDYVPDKKSGLTNLELMLQGKSPIFANGETFELHHVGQHAESPFAELLTSKHRRGKYNKILHTSNKEKSKIDRSKAFPKERHDYWVARAKEEIERRNQEALKNGTN